MEHDSSFNKQLRLKITARNVLNKKIKMSEVDIDEKNKNIYVVDKETKRNKKLILKRKKKSRTYTDLSSGENCYIPSGNGLFLKCINFIFEKDFSMEYSEIIKSYKRRPNVMTRCRIPKFCFRYELDIGIYDLNSKTILPRTVKQKIYVYTFIKIFIVLFGRKAGKILFLIAYMIYIEISDMLKKNKRR